MKNFIINLLPYLAYSFIFYGQSKQILLFLTTSNTDGIEIKDLICRATGQVLFLLALKLKKNDNTIILLSSIVFLLNLILIILYINLN